jgi:hypothetical protein
MSKAHGKSARVVAQRKPSRRFMFWFMAAPLLIAGVYMLALH